MGYFYSLRGWIQTDLENLDSVKERIKALQQSYITDNQEQLYMQGWCWASEQINWTGYIFYGRDVKASGLTLFENVLIAVCSLGCKIDGYFHAQGEDGIENITYNIVNDVYVVEPSGVLISITTDE